MKYIITVFLVFLACTSTLAGAGQFEDAAEAHKNGDFDKEFKLLMPLAQQGSPSAQYHIGLLYQQGKGVKQDYKEAITWFERAAAKNEDRASYSLAQTYAMGLGVAVDYKKAADIFSKLAEKNDTDAQRQMGYMYYAGLGVEQNFEKSVYWYRKSAEGGDDLAQSKLGTAYVIGKGVKEDWVHAMMWFNVAVDNGCSEVVKLRSQVLAKLTDEQKAKAEKLAKECTSRKFKDCDSFFK